MPLLLLGEEFRARIRPLQRIDEIGLHRNVRLGDEIGVMPLAEHLWGLVVKHHAPGGAKKRRECVHREGSFRKKWKKILTAAAAHPTVSVHQRFLSRNSGDPIRPIGIPLIDFFLCFKVRVGV